LNTICKLKKITLLILLFGSVASVSYGQYSSQKILSEADSLFMNKEWASARKLYEYVLKDTSYNCVEWNRLGFSNYNLKIYDDALKDYEKSLSQNPPPPLKALVYSRIAKIHAIKNEKQKALIELDSAAVAGYRNINELDTLIDFNNLRQEKKFNEIRQKVYAAAYPCMSDPHAREFDFWIGEWDVYQTGTKNYAGHSLVQLISGGCALLENWDSPASTGKSINFIDPVTNRWKQSWSGSYTNGNQEFVNGEYKDGAMRFTFETKDAQNNKLTGRFIFYNEGPDKLRQFNETSADGGKTWVTGYDFTYIRKK